MKGELEFMNYSLERCLGMDVRIQEYDRNVGARTSVTQVHRISDEEGGVEFGEFDYDMYGYGNKFTSGWSEEEDPKEDPKEDPNK